MLFERRLAGDVAAVEAALEGALKPDALAGEVARPERLVAAMRHAALDGGKRLRPFLVMETARLFGREGPGVIQAAAALECVHCYSLVHDDLPAMDDDDLRRGRPTVHRAFDEATAILAGDALLTLAFDLLADPVVEDDPAIRIGLVSLLARSAGLGGMVGGQMLDLAGQSSHRDAPSIARMQAMKTGALISAAVRIGAMLGHADDDARMSLDSYGRTVGLAFQLADDLLDVTAVAADAGKATGKDAARGKATLVGLQGVAAARARLNELIAEAEHAVSRFGERGQTLAEAARFVADRKN